MTKHIKHIMLNNTLKFMCVDLSVKTFIKLYSNVHVKSLIQYLQSSMHFLKWISASIAV